MQLVEKRRTLSPRRQLSFNRKLFYLCGALCLICSIITATVTVFDNSVPWLEKFFAVLMCISLALICKERLAVIDKLKRENAFIDLP